MRRSTVREIPKKDEVYEHFKGKRYQIIGIAKDADSLKEMVVYQGTYEPFPMYVRDLEEFMSPVDREKYPSVAQENRFEKCGPQEGLHPKLESFIEAETYEEKLEILSSMETMVTNDMINTMAMVLDVDIMEGELTERYAALKNALSTLEKFECNRFR